MRARPPTRAIEALAPAAEQNPFGMSDVVCLADRLVRGSVDVVARGPARRARRTRALAREVVPRPPAAIASSPGSTRTIRARSRPARVLAEGKLGKPGPVAYVCRGRTCSLPIANPGELARALATA